MKNFVVYLDNGEIVRSGICQDALVSAQATNNEYVIEAEVTNEYQYVENSVVIDMPPKPNGFYTFNYDSKQWEFDYTAAEDQAIIQRNQLLAEGPDRISPLWWASMSEQEQQAWTFYRQALLDITEQADYPEFIVWPIKP